MNDPAAVTDGQASAEARVKPRLRGVSHLLALPVIVPAVAWLSWASRAAPFATRVGVLVYGASLVFLFATSALYHGRHWPEPRRAQLGRVDHAAIFVLIAGSFTPFGLRMGSALGAAALVAIWLGALAGIALVIRPGGVGKKLRSAIYVGLGWFVVPTVPALYRMVGAGGLALLVAAGALYMIGALIYAARRPDPFPRTFGFHEIFHLLVIAASACEFLGVVRLVLG